MTSNNSLSVSVTRLQNGTLVPSGTALRELTFSVRVEGTEYRFLKSGPQVDRHAVSRAHYKAQKAAVRQDFLDWMRQPKGKLAGQLLGIKGLTNPAKAVIRHLLKEGMTGAEAVARTQSVCITKENAWNMACQLVAEFKREEQRKAEIIAAAAAEERRQKAELLAAIAPDPAVPARKEIAERERVLALRIAQQCKRRQRRSAAERRADRAAHEDLKDFVLTLATERGSRQYAS